MSVTVFVNDFQTVRFEFCARWNFQLKQTTCMDTFHQQRFRLCLVIPKEINLAGFSFQYAYNPNPLTVLFTDFVKT